MIGKFNLDRRDLTLDSEVIIDLIKAIDEFLVPRMKEGSSGLQAFADAYEQPPEIDDALLDEIIHFCKGSDPYNETFDSEEKTQNFVKRAVFPFKISSEKFQSTVQLIMKNQREFDYSIEE